MNHTYRILPLSAAVASLARIGKSGGKYPERLAEATAHLRDMGDGITEISIMLNNSRITANHRGRYPATVPDGFAAVYTDDPLLAGTTGVYCQAKPLLDALKRGKITTEKFTEVLFHSPPPFEEAAADSRSQLLIFDAEALRLALPKLLSSMAKDDVRSYLCGLAVLPPARNERNEAHLVSTDGHRLTDIVISLEIGTVFRCKDGGHLKAFDSILYRSLVEPLAKALGKKPVKGKVAVEIWKEAHRVEILLPNGLTLQGYTIKGNYPDWQRVMPLPPEKNPLRGPKRAVATIQDPRTFLKKIDNDVLNLNGIYTQRKERDAPGYKGSPGNIFTVIQLNGKRAMLHHFMASHMGRIEMPQSIIPMTGTHSDTTAPMTINASYLREAVLSMGGNLKEARPFTINYPTNDTTDCFMFTQGETRVVVLPCRY